MQKTDLTSPSLVEIETGLVPAHPAANDQGTVGSSVEETQQPGRDRRFSDYPTAATASPPIAAKRKHRMNPSAGTVDGEQDKAAQTTNNPPSEAQKSQNNPAPKIERSFEGFALILKI
ncbi:hypothetical protein pipiens_016069 [Culex pipiens pipiens]|uniref:Uncharacterized protein n=1 Tax=Culex pipiens pipiens TaxID=38569 RepID=A0ABD1CMU0_CULPP